VSEEEIKGVIRAIHGVIMEMTWEKAPSYCVEDAAAVYPYDMLAHAESVCFDGADRWSIARRRRILV